jgi:hypothetical protein
MLMRIQGPIMKNHFVRIPKLSTARSTSPTNQVLPVLLVPSVSLGQLKCFKVCQNFGR